VPVGFVLYTVRSGDFLASLAARFGVPVSEISCADLLNGCPLLAGQPDPILPTGLQLVIPDALDQARPVGPGNLLIPDSEVIFSTASNEFNVQSFVNEAGGFLADHNQYLMVNGWNSSADIVAMVAVEHSISPRLLLALLEYQCGCVYAVPGSLATIEPFLGATSAQYLRQDLYGQLDWAVNQLSTGYYGWRHGQLTEMTLKDGSVVRLNPEINAGTAAVQYVFARLYGLEAWQAAIDPEIGFMATYIEMFGDPDERALPIFEPGDAQPELTLPFLPGKTWAYTGGPHPSYEGNGPLASLDFAPAAAGEGCLPTDTWVAAVADGVIVRSEPGLVMQDLDGDGDEQSGWNIMYLHIGEAGRVAVGEVILSGEPIGRPSCEGGVASGTHLHIARKYNGEWVPADSILPFVLSGWVAANGAGPYFGTLTREGVVLEACVCSWARSWIQLDG
jgi:LysM repeat protein